MQINADLVNISDAVERRRKHKYREYEINNKTFGKQFVKGNVLQNIIFWENKLRCHQERLQTSFIDRKKIDFMQNNTLLNGL